MGEAILVVRRFLSALILVPAGSAFAAAVRASFSAGADLAGYRVQELVQCLQDTEVYRCVTRDGQAVAVKLARSQYDARSRALLAHEATILGLLKSVRCAELVAHGTHRDQPFVATRWIEGEFIDVHAATLRRYERRRQRDGLHALCVRLFEAYQGVHSRGVVHGDVHLRNARVSASGVVVLLDFGLARQFGGSDTMEEPRVGLGPFLEPEAARAILAGRPAPPASVKGEQYAVAALAHTLLCGQHPMGIPPDRDAFHRLVAASRPRSFAEVGGKPWPAIEAVLRRALDPDPASRYGDMEALLAAFVKA